ncbi:precorrin-2 C(20)-methyltransferase [Commensalibacter oyaizuii]|uniref:Precorrin-2 C(20)-methyltransferase n=1 Tax=Commensalibacter oyaizuii TaxID=3043873 RepID=A0ABT6Q1G4_9PROT|nr:precorrin-2 C(20)-methyltransferase [Commensalibacter sp. TBRC 16381]MDI2090931.1 precorrin-2 C(20)-methyltransferase [Commensalibacter sp. TBRC 16381]
MQGKLNILGMGPGDPELVTRKAERLLRSHSIFAYFAKKGEKGHARHIAQEFITNTHQELRFEYPITTEIPHKHIEYKQALQQFYDQSAHHIQHHLDQGETVNLLCEGDPLLYGSAMYILERLSPTYTTEIVPGICAMNGCWSAAKLPIVKYEQTLTVIPATLPLEQLTDKLYHSDSVVIMKIGRHLAKVKSALQTTDLLNKAVYIERGTQLNQRILPMTELTQEHAPYFSLILITG